MLTVQDATAVLLRSKQTCLSRLLHKHCLEISSSTSYRHPVLRDCASYVTRNCLGQCFLGFYDEQLPVDSVLRSSSQLVGHLPIHRPCRVEGQPCSKSCKSLPSALAHLIHLKSLTGSRKGGWRITCVHCSEESPLPCEMSSSQCDNDLRAHYVVHLWRSVPWQPCLTSNGVGYH